MNRSIPIRYFDNTEDRNKRRQQWKIVSFREAMIAAMSALVGASLMLVIFNPNHDSCPSLGSM